MIPADTAPEAFLTQVAWLRRLDGPGRLALTLQMCDESRELAASGVRRRRPDMDESAVRREVIRLLNVVAPTIE